MRAYSDKKSPKDFTQRQLFACLVLKTYLKATYRGVVEQIILMPAVRKAVGLKQVPHWTTPQKFSDRANILTLVDRALRELGKEVLAGTTSNAAMDSTGVETTCASARAPTPARLQTARDSFGPPMAGCSSSMRSESWVWISRRCCCTPWRGNDSSRWEPTPRSTAGFN